MGINLSENRSFPQQVKTAGILFLPVVLFLIPFDWLVKQHSICLFKCITGKECYGCGMTRALLSAMHFRVSDAYHYNKLFIVVLPLLALVWVKAVIRLLNKA